MNAVYSFEFEYTTNAYSKSCSKKTGDSNVNVVALEPSVEVFTSAGFFVTVEKGITVWPG